MNQIGIKLALGAAVVMGLYTIYYLIGENARLEKDKQALEASIEETQNAVFALGKIVTDLNVKYSGATNEEFKRFKKADINKENMADVVASFNIGSGRVLRDYKNKINKFIHGNTKTASP